MQPFLSVLPGSESMVYLNGRFAGEAGPGEGLLLPVVPRGAVYIETKPLSPGAPFFAVKLVLSGGHVLPDSVGEGAFAVEWPGGVTEVEIGEGTSEEDEMPTGLEKAGIDCLSAYFAGDIARAESYLAPAYAATHPIARAAEGGEAACSLKFQPPSAPAVGLLRRLSPRAARVEQLFLAGQVSAGVWRISEFQRGI